MLPEEWQSIRHLLLSCFWEDTESLESLLVIVNLLYTKLKTTNIQLLILTDAQYSFFPVDHLLPQKSFIPCLSLYQDYLSLIEQIQRSGFDAAIALTTPAQSPFSLAYLCYLAHIPIRFGQSREFGGGVLSQCIQPPVTPMSTVDYNLHLLRAIGLPGWNPLEPAIA